MGENSLNHPRAEMIQSFLFSTSLLQQSCPHPSELMGSIKHISWEPIMAHDIRWNFEKFLVGPDGVPVMRWFHQARQYSQVRYSGRPETAQNQIGRPSRGQEPFCFLPEDLFKKKKKSIFSLYSLPKWSPLD